MIFPTHSLPYKYLCLLFFCITSDVFAQLPLTGIEKPVTVSIAHIICGRTRTIMIDGDFACRRCPRFTSNQNFEEPLLLKAMINGHFSSAKKNEMLVDTDGCEPHNNSFGGLVLLRQIGDNWQYKSYQPKFRLNECLKFSAKGLSDVLVCNEIDSTQGEVFGQYSLFQFDQQEAIRTVLQNWFVDKEANFTIAPVSANKKFIDKGKLSDLRLTFSMESNSITKKNVTLDFIFDGKILTIAKYSEADKQQLDKLLYPYITSN